MPVWHQATKKWRDDGRLVLLGVTQEQHPDRCRLFAQWNRIDWPIVWDPINTLESAAVPLVVAIDEHGIVRALRPAVESFEQDFLAKTFADDAPTAPLPPLRPPDLNALHERAKQASASRAWRDFGDALALWGGSARLDDAIDAYGHGHRLDRDDGNALFRLGVCYRMRHESDRNLAGDFQHAVDYWEMALALNPNQYIWRRRIQQYGPQLIKPYAFYDWVTEAHRDIAARGERPITLSVMPYGAEMAKPSKSFVAANGKATSPDPGGRIHRDQQNLIEAEITVVPARLKPGDTARVHVTFRPNARLKAHWNNESDPLKLWVESAGALRVSQHLLVAQPSDRPETNEVRRLDFEIQVPREATGALRLSAYALYNVCEGAGGSCQFLRRDLDFKVEVAAL